MDFDSKKILILILSILLIIGVVIGYVVFFDDKPIGDLGLSDDRLFSDEDVEIRPAVVNEFVSFNKPEELDNQELEDNQESQITEEKKVYLKGELVEKTSEKIKVKTSEGIVEVYLSRELALRCEPEFLTDKNGNQISADKVFFDYSFLNIDKQSQITSETVNDIFMVGDKIVVIAEKENEKLVAKMVVGYGCETSRDLKL